MVLHWAFRAFEPIEGLIPLNSPPGSGSHPRHLPPALQGREKPPSNTIAQGLLPPRFSRCRAPFSATPLPEPRHFAVFAPFARSRAVRSPKSRPGARKYARRSSYPDLEKTI
jgi:hypothetical protein